MQLIVIRHGKAEDAATSADGIADDTLRALTREGQEQMKQAARGLAKIVESIDIVASSPLKRAVQTAQIVCDAYDHKAPLERDELVPGTPGDRLLRWLRTNKVDATIAIVGHEPDLSRHIGFLLTGKPNPIVEMKKGAVCVLEFQGKPMAGKGVLKFLMTRKQLERQA